MEVAVVVVTRDTTRTGVAAKGGGKRTSFSRPILVGVVPVAAMENENQKGKRKTSIPVRKTVRVSSQPVTHAMNEGIQTTWRKIVCEGKRLSAMEKFLSQRKRGNGKGENPSLSLSLPFTSKERRDWQGNELGFFLSYNMERNECENDD